MALARLKRVLAIGLMSGTSLDGVDAAVLETDGLDRVEPQGFCSIGYDDGDREICGRRRRTR